MTERDRLDQRITERLLAFYDGLLKRGQIMPPKQTEISEELPTCCREDLERESNRSL